jgi:arylsulfatase A-like enzyme
MALIPSRRAFLAAMLAADQRPNILLFLADNWAFPHASVLGDPVVKTSVFDTISREGTLFTHAFAPNPSCSPSRSMLLTGQETHRLGEAASLYGPLSPEIPRYTMLLEKAGYFVGFTGKGWGPGTSPGGNPAGRQYKDFAAFLAARPKDKPFCFWFGSHDPHVPWDRGAQFKDKIDTTAFEVPAHLPDHRTIRDDIRNYYAEVMQFDSECGEHLAVLDRAGERDRTLVAMTGDNGWQMPRGLGNCYDLGVRVPLALRWPGHIGAGKRHDGFVTLGDLCPTFLEAAGVAIPAAITAKSLLHPPNRDEIFLERERHANVRKGDLSYPIRGVRTREFLYLRNVEPSRWPAGDPEMYWVVGEFGDVDETPSKRLIMEMPDRAPYRYCFGKRPAEELYDCRKDPSQVRNLADDAAYRSIRVNLATKVQNWMRSTNDPRAKGEREFWDKAPYSGPKGRTKK